MPKARKLKSGSWNCTVYAGRDETGKRKYKSFTVRDPTRAGKKECERLAAEWSAQHQDTPPGQLTVYEAVRKYIDIKEKVLSPSTIRSYELYLKKRIKPIQDRRIDDLTQQDVQQWINSLATDCTPKYIKNVYGLFSAALAYYETRSYTVTFPSVAPEPTYTPCDDDIALLLGTYGIARNSCPASSWRPLAASGAGRFARCSPRIWTETACGCAKAWSGM